MNTGGQHSYYDPNQQQGQYGYQQQPWPPQQMMQQPQSNTGRSMAIAAIICFAVAWIAGIGSIIPLFGLVFLCFALTVHLLGFIFLAIAISKWPR